MDIDYNDYTTEELFQALESVDDYEYTDRAITILKLIMERLNLSLDEINAEVLGWTESDFHLGRNGNSINLLAVLFSERNLIHANVHQKIERLVNYLKNNESA